jgi:outer membrane protein assembly factor BamB
MRILVGALLATAVLAGCSSTKELPAVPQITPTVEPRVLWKNDIGRADFTSFTPQLQGEQIYDANARSIKIIDAATGATRQSISTPKLISGTGTDGTTTVVAGEKGMVYAYDADGKQIWQVKANSEVIAPAVVNNGHAMVRSIDGRVTAYAVADGSQQWQFSRPNPALALRNHTPVTAVGGLVFVGLANGQMVGLLEENGGPVWEALVAMPRGVTELDRAVDVLAKPIVVGQTVCTVAFQGRVACFGGGNGSPVWARQMSSVNNLTTDGQGIYGTDTKGNILAFNAMSGEPVWQQEQLAGRELGAPVAFERYLVLGDQEGYVYFVNRASGALEGIVRVDSGPIRLQPLVYNNSVIVKTTKGTLVALGI